MIEQLSKNQRKMRRSKLNKQLREDPKWAGAFRMYDIRFALAQRAGDEVAMHYVDALRRSFTRMIREATEKGEL